MHQTNIQPPPEEDRPFCFLFRFNVSPVFYITVVVTSRRAEFRQGVRACRARKAGSNVAKGPLKAASTNLWPGWTSQKGTTTDRHSSKCRATAPSIWRRHSTRREALPAWEERQETPSPACMEQGISGGQEKKQSQRCNPTEPQGFKSLVWSVNSGVGFQWTRSAAVSRCVHAMGLSRCCGTTKPASSSRSMETGIDGAKMHGRSGQAVNTSSLSTRA